MVAPLFFIALIADRSKMTSRMMKMRKTFKYKLFSKEITLTFAELLSGAIFLIMGAITVYYAFMGNVAVHSDYQITINIYFDKLLKFITKLLTPIANYVWIVLAIFAVFLINKLLKLFSGKQVEEKNHKD
jgi:hypothetical protein